MLAARTNLSRPVGQHAVFVKCATSRSDRKQLVVSRRGSAWSRVAVKAKSPPDDAEASGGRNAALSHDDLELVVAVLVRWTSPPLIDAPLLTMQC